MNDWQPIETAPKDGREIRLKRLGDERTYTGRWYERSGERVWLAWWTWHVDPAQWRWMPVHAANAETTT